MKPEEAFEIRRQRWEKFKEHFVPSVIQDVINNELKKYSPGGKNLTFPVDHDDWLLMSWVPIFYYWYGFEQKDEVELPSYIEATSRFPLNGVNTGPRTTVKMIPPKRVGDEYTFIDLKGTVRGAMSGQRVDPLPEVFTVESIMSDPTAPPSADETALLVERLIDTLVEMGYGRRGATKTATKTLAANPGTDSIDELLNLAIKSS